MVKSEREIISDPDYAPHDSLEFVEEFTWGYQRALSKLKNLYPSFQSVKRVFVGGCGYGADVQAIGRELPESQITAVSLRDTPTEKVKLELGERLQFRELTILEHLEEASRQEKPQQFDLVAILNVNSGELRKVPFYDRLDVVTHPGSFVLTSGPGEIPLKDDSMLQHSFRRIPLSRSLAKETFKLWRKEK